MKINMLEKMSVYELIFMCFKQKSNLYFFKYDILLIFIDFYVSFPCFWQIFATRIRIIDTDPGGQMIRIRPDPDPHHWTKPIYAYIIKT